MNRIPMLNVSPDVGDAFGPRSHPSGQALLRVLAADAVSIAIAGFCIIYFVAEFLR